MAEIVTNNTDRQKLIHLHTSGAAAPGVELLNEGEIAVSSNISGASIYTLQHTDSGTFEVVKFITEAAVDKKIEVFSDITDGYIDGVYDAISESESRLSEAMSALTNALRTEVLGTVESGESATTIMDVARALETARKALNVTAVGHDAVSAWTESSENGIEVHVSLTAEDKDALEAAKGAVLGLEEGSEAGVSINDSNELNFSQLKINCGEF